MTFLLPLLVLISSALPFLTGTVYYMVADDYLLNYIANGSYGRDFSAHLTFIKMPVGLLLRWLYGVTDSVNWYFLLLLGLVVLSSLAFLFVIWRRTGSPLLIALACLVNYMIVARFLSFTVVAYLVAGSGICFFLSALKDKKRILPGFAVMLLGLLTAFFLRRDAALSSLLLFSPLLAAPLFDAQGRAGLRRYLRAFAALLAALVLSLGLSFALEKSAYEGEAWQAFTRYDNARSAVVDNYTVPYGRVKKEMKALGMSRLDNNLLNSWRYAEKSFFTRERLEAVAALNRNAVTLSDRAEYAKKQLPADFLPFLLMPLVLFGLLIAGGRIRRSRRSLLFPCLLLLFGAGLLFILAFVRLRFVMRVVLPTQLLVASGLITCADPFEAETAAGRFAAGDLRGRVISLFGRLRPGSGMRRNALLADAAALIVLTLTLFSYLAYFQSINPVDRISPDEPPYAALTQEIAAHRDTLYVFDSSALSRLYYYGTPASQVRTTTRFANVTRAGSWDSYSPRYYAQLSPYLDNADDLLSALVESDSIAYITSGDGAEIAAFYRERHGKRCIFHEEAVPGTDMKVIRFGLAPEGQVL